VEAGGEGEVEAGGGGWYAGWLSRWNFPRGCLEIGILTMMLFCNANVLPFVNYAQT
jgi:hypothetical protein